MNEDNLKGHLSYNSIPMKRPKNRPIYKGIMYLDIDRSQYSLLMGTGFLVGGDANVLNLNCGDGYSLNILKKKWNYTL